MADVDSNKHGMYDTSFYDGMQEKYSVEAVNEVWKDMASSSNHSAFEALDNDTFKSHFEIAVNNKQQKIDTSVLTTGNNNQTFKLTEDSVFYDGYQEKLKENMPIPSETTTLPSKAANFVSNEVDVISGATPAADPNVKVKLDDNINNNQTFRLTEDSVFYDTQDMSKEDFLAKYSKEPMDQNFLNAIGMTQEEFLASVNNQTTTPVNSINNNQSFQQIQDSLFYDAHGMSKEDFLAKYGNKPIDQDFLNAIGMTQEEYLASVNNQTTAPVNSAQTTSGMPMAAEQLAAILGGMRLNVDSQTLSGLTNEVILSPSTDFATSVEGVVKSLVKPLFGVDLSPNAESYYNGAVTEITTFMTSLNSSIATWLGELENADQPQTPADGPKNPTRPSGSSGSSGPSSSSGPSGPGATTPVPPTGDPITPTDPEDPTEGLPTSGVLTAVELIKFDALLRRVAANENISYEDLISKDQYKHLLQKIKDEDKITANVNVLVGDVPTELLKSELDALATKLGLTPGDLINNPEHASHALALLSAVGISDVAHLTGAEAQSILQGLLTEQLPSDVGMDVVGVTGLLDELTAYANENNIPLEELLSNPEYASLLKDKMMDIGNAHKEVSNIIDIKSSQEALKDAYNNDNSSSYLKTYVDAVAKENNVTVDKFLSDETNTKLVESSLNNLQNQTMYLKGLTELKGEGIQTTLSHLYSGKEPGLLGLTKSETENMKAVLDNVAAANKDKTESAATMLKDRSFANSLKENISYVDTSKKLGSILKNASNDTVQSVLYNIYSS